jgi:hypothetical protein
MCHKKRNTGSTTSRNNPYICGNLTSEEELLMLTEKEVRDDKNKIDNKQVESSAQKPMPSIWYN